MTVTEIEADRDRIQAERDTLYRIQGRQAALIVRLRTALGTTRDAYVAQRRALGHANAEAHPIVRIADNVLRAATPPEPGCVPH